MTNTDKQRILDLRGQGFTYANIADTLGIPVGTVKSFCYRKNNVKYTDDECKHCGKSLKHTPKSKRKLYCNDSCRLAWWSRNRHLLTHRIIKQSTCRNCGKPFEWYDNKQLKYCSQSCYFNHRYGKDDGND